MFYVSYFFEIAALVAGLYYYKKIQPAIYRLLVVVLFLTIVNEMLAYLKMYEQLGIAKSLVYNIFFGVEIVAFCNIYYSYYTSHGFHFQRTMLTGIFIFCSAAGIFFLTRFGVSKFNPFFLNAVCFFLISAGILYYYAIYSNNKIDDFKKDPLFWFSTGLIIVNFIHLLFVNAVFVESFRKNPDSKVLFQGLNTFGNIIYYSLIIFSFKCSSQFRKQAGI